VNFNNGSIAGGRLAVYAGPESADGSQKWMLNFYGSLNNGVVSLTANQNSISINDILKPAVNAQLGGFFTGSTGEGFIGAFSLIDGGDTSNFVKGAYSLGGILITE